MSMKDVQKTAEVARQTGHGPAYRDNDPKTAANHNADLQKVERLHQRVHQRG